MGDEEGCGFGQGEERVFLDGGVGWERAAGQAGDQGAGEEEVLLRPGGLVRGGSVSWFASRRWIYSVHEMD